MPSRSYPVPQFLFLKDVLPRNKCGHTCEGTLNMQESTRKGTSFWSPRCCRGVACSRQNWSHCCSLRINKITKEKFKDGEVLKGAAERSRKPFHTAPVNCGFLSKAAVLPRRKENQNCNQSLNPPPPHLPLFREISISCVGISFSVNISKIHWEVNLREIWLGLAVNFLVK